MCSLLPTTLNESGILEGSTAPGSVQEFNVTVTPQGVSTHPVPVQSGPPKRGRGFLGLHGDLGYILIGVIVAAAVILVIVVLIRKRKEKEQPSPSPPAGPPP